MQQWIRQIINTWLDRRIPPANRITLDQRRIFVFPSRYGCLYLCLCLAIFIGATNYEKNMLYALTFWLFGMFLIAILHSFTNLSGLTLTAIKSHTAFAGTHAEFELELSTTRRGGHEDIQLAWPGQEPVLTCVEAKRPNRVILTHRTNRRGWLRPGRLRVESVYPLGLIRVWTWVDLDVRALVYPNPIPTRVRPITLHRSEEGHELALGYNEEFRGFRDYQPGDPLRHVVWKSLAKGPDPSNRVAPRLYRPATMG